MYYILIYDSHQDVTACSSVPSSSSRHLTEEFLVQIEKEIISALVPVLMFLKEMTPSPYEMGGLDSNGGVGSISIGSRVFYYSRAYEQAAHSPHPLVIEGIVTDIHLSEGSRAQEMSAGGLSLEVVLANGARECYVNPDDVIYTAVPLLGYQRLILPQTEVGNGLSGLVQGVEETKTGISYPLPQTPGKSVMVDTLSRSCLGRHIWRGTGLSISVLQGGPAPVEGIEIEGEQDCTTSHLLRILAYTTHITSKRAGILSSHKAPFPLLTPSSYLKSDHDFEVLAGLSTWLCLSAFSHHSLAFIPQRATPATLFINGRPGMIEQLEYLKMFSVGDSQAMHPPKWSISKDWEEYSKCIRTACDALQLRLRDEIFVVSKTPDVVQAPLKGTKIGLKTKLHFVSTPE
jgi:hypothetical protein